LDVLICAILSLLTFSLPRPTLTLPVSDALMYSTGIGGLLLHIAKGPRYIDVVTDLRSSVSSLY